MNTFVMRFDVAWWVCSQNFCGGVCSVHLCTCVFRRACVRGVHGVCVVYVESACVSVFKGVCTYYSKNQKTDNKRATTT